MTPVKHFLVVTAFGKFAGVLHNPTSVLSAALPALVPAHVRLVFNQVLTVAIQDCDQAISSIYREKQNQARVIVIHLGVASGRTVFSLQKCSKNIMQFRCPDERGNCPLDEPIRKSSDKSCLYNQLDLASLADRLRGLGHEVQESLECGEFICNYLYFRSLQQQVQKGRVRRVFVHVPSFEAIDEEGQSKFLIDLINNISWN